MTGKEIYNTIWLAIWGLCLIGGIWGLCLGNWKYGVFIAGSLCYIGLILFDDEDGECLKDFFMRKFKAYRG